MRLRPSQPEVVTLRPGIADMHGADTFHDVQEGRLLDAPPAKHRPVLPKSPRDDVVDRRRRPRSGIRVYKMAMPHVPLRFKVE